MKTLSTLIVALMAVSLFTSCQKEDIQPQPQPEPEIDLAAEVEGTYLGSISYGEYIYLDYEVTVTRISNNKVRCEGEDNKLPQHTFEIKEADEIVGKDWITQPDTYQLDSIFTFVRADSHLTIIRTDFGASFGGYQQ